MRELIVGGKLFKTLQLPIWVSLNSLLGNVRSGLLVQFTYFDQPCSYKTIKVQLIAEGRRRLCRWE